MLKLRDFLHLPQLDSLIRNLVEDGPGLIILAGIDSRPGVAQAVSQQTTDPLIPSSVIEGITPSGLSAIFNILMQEILLAHPFSQALVVAEGNTLSRVPRQLARRVRLLKVDEEFPYAQQIDIAVHQRPGLLVIDRLCEANAPAVFDAAASGLRVLTLFDTVLRGAAVARQLIDLGVTRQQLSVLRYILTTQRMSVLCEHCKRPVTLEKDHIERICGRYAHLRQIITELIPVDDEAVGHTDRKSSGPPSTFFRAVGCDHCHQTGFQGDMAVFDLFRNDPNWPDFFTQTSLLSLEEYVLRLAGHGQLDLDDLLDMENEHLRRTYQMLNASERALTSANAALRQKLLELEASNRVLVQRTEVLMSLQDLGQALIGSADLSELAARVCRKTSELCGADRIVLYLRRVLDGEKETAEVLAVRGWEPSAIGTQVPPARVFDRAQEGKPTRYMHDPPGVRPLQARSTADGGNALIRMGLRVPLIAQDNIVGVMIVQCTQKSSFTPGENALLQTYANQAALAIQRAGLFEELRAKIDALEAAQAGLVKKERMERELELAHQVQQSMIPQSFPPVSGFVIAARNEPARQVGGDFYDMILLDEDHFGLVIADVADKGMPAALYMALTRSLLLAEARRQISPGQTLINVNRLLLELGELNGFVSVFYGIINRNTHQMVYTRAGHERPLLLKDGGVRRLPGDGTVLGVLDSSRLSLTEELITFGPGDRLILYTDGLTDVANADGIFFGLPNLELLVQQHNGDDANQMCSQIFTHLADYRGSEEQFDDMTLMILEVQ